jgi:hypothetical protein
MLRLLLTILAVSHVCISTCVAEDIPFTIEKGFLIIPVKIKKDIPAEVAISTGSPESFIKTDFITRHKIILRSTDEHNEQGEVAKTIYFAQVPDLVVGDQKPGTLPMKLRTFESLDKRFGREIAAILGADFFKGKILQIDFKNKVLRFLDKSPFDYKQPGKLMSGEIKPLLFKMDQQVMTTFGDKLTLPVAPDVGINDAKVRTLFTTGEANAVLLSPAAVSEYGFGVPPAKGMSKNAQINSLLLDGFEIQKIPVVLLGPEAGFDKTLKEYGATIGLAVLQNFTVTFDWKEKMLVLQR